jgi:hypothetical protein
MRRREFMTLFGGAAAASPLAARAQQGDGRPAALLSRILQLRADGIADKISLIINGIVSQIGWTTQLPWSVGTMDQRRVDALRLLRQAVPVTDIAFLDASGTEQLKVSRLAMDEAPSKGALSNDFSKDPKFTEAVAHKVYFGPVYLRRDTVYMTLSLAGTRRESGVSVAELNLALEQFVQGPRIGEQGVIYILDAQGRVIVHPDMFIPVPGTGGNRFTVDLSLFQRNFSGLAQVQAALAANSGPTQVRAARDINGHEVLSASAGVAGPDWHVFVELPLTEADTAVP